jgi:peptide/nickel transport system permease protein
MPSRPAILRILLRIPLTLAFAGLLGILLVRMAPGFGVDERELDARYDSRAVAGLRTEGPTVWAIARDFAGRLQSGDWGSSQSLGLPVRQLLAERWPVTVASIGIGLVLAWCLALLLGVAGVLWRGFDWLGSGASFGLLSLPAGLVAFLVFLAGAPAGIGIAAVVFPQIFRYVRQLMRDAMEQPCIFAAAARGVGRAVVVLRHAGALVRPQLLSLLGVSCATALGAAIPMEALCDSPGLGHLAWKAAVSRDLDLLAPLILVITLAIVVANALADLFAPQTAAAAEESLG